LKYYDFDEVRKLATPRQLSLSAMRSAGTGVYINRIALIIETMRSS
jgi:hypothetical protein